MWTTTYQSHTPAAPAAVWAAITALHSGTPIGPNSDSFELHGPFAVGTQVTVTPVGQDAMTSTIIEVEPEVAYADETIFGELRLVFRHVLEAQPDGGTAVSHTLMIDGPHADEIGPELGPQISGDFPVAMAELCAAAENGVHG
ncbi:MAG: hypothetical protein LWW77_06680 [Propionibacteriales bacterium]|nr:hypothetical protein [Propionibacteriales bacterium]